MTTAMGAGWDFDDVGLPIQKEFFFNEKGGGGRGGFRGMVSCFKIRRKGTRKKKNLLETNAT
jgi:hypothetical protein